MALPTVYKFTGSKYKKSVKQNEVILFCPHCQSYTKTKAHRWHIGQ